MKMKKFLLHSLLLLNFFYSESSFAVSEEELNLEDEIRWILEEKTNLPMADIRPGFCKDFSPNLNEGREECVTQLKKLKSVLLKVKKIKDLSQISKIEIYSDPNWKSQSFYWKNKLNAVFLGTNQDTTPWMSLFSEAPLEEEAPEFKTQKMASLIQLFRDQPPAGNKGSKIKSQLRFLPYSSSYLSLKGGRIIKTPQELKKKTVVDPEAASLAEEPISMLSENVQSKYWSSSPVERLERARESELGQSDRILTHEFRQRVHDPNAQTWEGFCHQWTAAALNPQINDFITSTQGLICNDIYISEGELEELFTLFYTNYTSKLIAGKRANRIATSTDQMLRNEFGIDDLNPYEFHKNIFKFIDQGKGIAIEVSPDPEVWNHPVFGAETVDTRFLTEPAALQGIAPLIPADLIESVNPDDDEFLQRYRELDAKLRKWQESEAELSTSENEWVAEGTHKIKELIDQSALELNSIRSDFIVKFIAPALAKGRLKLKSGVSVVSVTTRLDYGDEDMGLPFARTGFNAQSKEFQYLLFNKDKKVIDSRWVTPPGSRPDFLWSYNHPKDSLTGKAALGPEVQDLLRLGSACRSAREVLSFFSFVRQAVADSVLTEEEKREIQKRYPRISSVIKQGNLRQLFTQNKIKNIDLSEVFRISPSDRKQ